MHMLLARYCLFWSWYKNFWNFTIKSNILHGNKKNYRRRWVRSRNSERLKFSAKKRERSWQEEAMKMFSLISFCQRYTKWPGKWPGRDMIYHLRRYDSVLVFLRNIYVVRITLVDANYEVNLLQICKMFLKSRDKLCLLKRRKKNCFDHFTVTILSASYF